MSHKIITNRVHLFAPFLKEARETTIRWYDVTPIGFDEVHKPYEGNENGYNCNCFKCTETFVATMIKELGYNCF